ncbi:class I SAM-dependent methyltransferase [Desulfosediminicola ganghwensis]|uniref:class I SAM-dependent methyltransferase n=1 Tax=Desulfosediminicola ganghwensis TaxID=2569540 RepID=UPI001C3CCACA|nr:class I SAM-dependent methyltransferase [Desulfosediminicola ganghwensis]
MKKAPMYTRYAREYERAIEDNIYNARFERPSLLSMLPDVAGKSVLDLGCGPGVYAEILLQRGAEVTAVDASSEMVARVKEKFGSRIKTYIQDVSEGLPQEADFSHDLVICPLAVHYIKELAPLFQEIYRVLKHDGTFLFSTHHPMMDFQSSPSGNYFRRELVTETWDTIGNPVDVQFYRRSLTELFGSITEAGLYISNFSEGIPDKMIEEVSPADYQRLSKLPTFMFIECKKNN